MVASEQNMRKSLWLVILILFVVMDAPFASADTSTDGTLSFTVSTGSIPAPTGSFIYDNTTNQFTSFMITWDGLGFDLVSSSGSGGLDSINSVALQQSFWSSAPCAGTTAATANFNVLSNGAICGPLTWLAQSGNFESNVVLFGDPSNNLISDDSNGFVGPVVGSDRGSFIVSESTVPEPSTLILVVTAIMFVSSIRQRICQTPA
jgi:hypothetical protein